MKDTDRQLTPKELEDKAWFDATFEVVAKWMATNGLVLAKKSFGDGYETNVWTHPDCWLRLTVRPDSWGNWQRHEVHRTMVIKCSNDIRNFSKKIERATNKTDDVLAKIAPKIVECVTKKQQDTIAYEAENARKTFQSAYMEEHFTDTGKFSVYPASGTDNESIRFKISASYLTADEVRLVLAALKD